MAPRHTVFPAGPRNFELRRGLTLVELMVVVAIMATLAWLVTQGLERTKDRAREAKCMALLRGIGTGLQVYAAENQQQFPVLTSDNVELQRTGKAGAMDLRFELYTYDSALWNAVCPSDPRRKGDPNSANPTYVSYVYLQSEGLDLGKLTRSIPTVRDSGYFHGRPGQWKSTVLFTDQHLEMETW